MVNRGVVHSGVRVIGQTPQIDLRNHCDATFPVTGFNATVLYCRVSNPTPNTRADRHNGRGRFRSQCFLKEDGGQNGRHEDAWRAHRTNHIAWGGIRPRPTAFRRRSSAPQTVPVEETRALTARRPV